MSTWTAANTATKSEKKSTEAANTAADNANEKTMFAKA